MPDPSACVKCGTALEPGATLCPNCGKLVATVPKNPWLGILSGTLGIAVGVLFAVLYLSYLLEAGSSGSCAHVITGDVVSAAAIAGAAGAFFYALRVVRRKHPHLGIALMSAAIVFLLPVAPCGIATIAFSRC